MDFSQSKMAGNPHTTWYIEILVWLKDNAIVWTSFLLGWKGLDLGFKYLNNGRDAAIRAVVKDEISKGVGIDIKQLSTDIKELSHSIFELRNKI